MKIEPILTTELMHPQKYTFALVAVEKHVFAPADIVDSFEVSWGILRSDPNAEGDNDFGYKLFKSRDEAMMEYFTQIGILHTTMSLSAVGKFDHERFSELLVRDVSAHAGDIFDVEDKYVEIIAIEPGRFTTKVEAMIGNMHDTITLDNVSLSIKE